MKFLDITIILILIYAAWRGFKKGFILELFTFLALFLGLYAGIHFSDFVANVFRNKMGMTSEYVPVISFTIVFLLIGAMVYFGGKALEKVVKIAQLSMFNKLLGTFFSVVKVVFICGGVIIIAESYDEKNDFLSEEVKNESLFFSPIKDITMLSIPAFGQSTVFLKNALKEEPTVEINEQSIVHEI